MWSGDPKSGLMSNSGLSPAAPIGKEKPQKIKPAGGSRKTGTPTGRHYHTLGPLSLYFLCHRMLSRDRPDIA